MARKNDKRTRLVDAANKLFHQEGVTNTTLAKIASLAGVPLGNVYYYFKSKEAIILAVIERRRATMTSLFQEWEQATTAKDRLRLMVERALIDAQESAKYGDSLGSLCQELSKQGGSVATAASDMMHDVLHWAEKQFIDLGKGEQARNHALNLISSLQGMSLLSLTFNNAEFMSRQGEFLTHWLESI